jgi:hypothetical protein
MALITATLWLNICTSRNTYKPFLLDGKYSCRQRALME